LRRVTVSSAADFECTIHRLNQEEDGLRFRLGVLLAFAFFFTVQTLCSAPDLETLASEKNLSELSQDAGEMLHGLANLRGVPVHGKVKIAFADKEFFARYYLRQLQAQYPSQTKNVEETAFRTLGLLGQKDDLFFAYLRVFLSMVRGLYDPDTKTLYLLEGLSAGEQERVMAHELVHALQDQEWGLRGLLDGLRELTLDGQFARIALIEGEAEGLSLDWRLREQGKDFTQLGDIASWVEQGNYLERKGLKAIGKRSLSADTINFSYVYGLTFFQHWVRQKGWKTLDELFRNPPQTTQQIINEEDYYLKRQTFVRVQMDDLSNAEGPLTGYRKVWENSLGEFGWETILQTALENEEAAQIMKGWEGDEIQVYKRQGDLSCPFVGYVLFRENSSAEKFFSASKTCLVKKWPDPIPIRTDDTIFWVTLGSGKEAYLERYGRRVIWLEGIPFGKTPLVRSKVLDFKRSSG
jgi:hypothetical protein